MAIVTESLVLTTEGRNDTRDLTGEIAAKLAATGLLAGIVTVFVPGSTGGVTTIEFEPGAVEDFGRLMDKIAPENLPYRHDLRWGDGNGYAHIRASLLGPSLTVPFAEGRLMLGTWQQVIFVDFDNRPRTRTVVLQFMGE
ncbi:MAG: secondary thiamine-phosphate synthase enzyme YjbQ [Acidobacteriota bacterium]|nr:secondary thiamine-phosphate synthase enzyme YjbQ [Acidobacteriota bacterium]